MGLPDASASFAKRSLVRSLTRIVVLIRWSLQFSRFTDLLPYRSARGNRLRVGLSPKMIRESVSVLSLIMRCAVQANARSPAGVDGTRTLPRAGDEHMVP